MRWKWVAGIVIGLMIVFPVAAYILLSAYDFDRFRPEITRAVQEATGRELTIGRPISVKPGLIPVIAVGDVSFQNAPWGSAPNLLEVERCEVQIAILPLIRGVLEVKRLELLQPRLYIETSRTGESNMDFEAASSESERLGSDERRAPPASQGFPAFGFEVVEMQDAVVTYRGGTDGSSRTLRLDHFSARAEGVDTAIEIELEGSYEGAPFEIKGETGSLAALMKGEQAWDVSLAAEAEGVDLQLKGSLRDVLHAKGFRFTVEAEAASLEKVPGWTGAASGGWPGPVRCSFVISDMETGAYNVSDLDIQAGESDMKGELQVETAGARPMIKGVLTSNRLDLRPYIPESASERPGDGGSAGNGKGSATSERVFSTEPIGLRPVDAVDLDLGINLQTIFLPGWAFEGVHARLLLDRGMLKINDIKASAEQGSVSGRCQVKPSERGAYLDAVVKVKELDVGEMLGRLKREKFIAGRMDMDLALSGAGASLAEIMADLDGKLSLVMGEGRMDSRKINFLGANAVQVLLQAIDPAAKRQAYTEFNCLVVGFHIAGGIARSTALVLDTDLTSLAGSGQVDLRDETLDVTFALHPKSGVTVPGLGKLGVSIGELTKPFKLSGTLKNPAIRFDARETARMVGKALGGTALFGPAGIAAALASGTAGGGNPCLSAIEAAEKGVPAESEKREKDAVGDAVEEAGKMLERIFGR